MVDKAFGTHTGKGSARVESSDIYDLASLTKTTATLLAVMKLYDKGRFNLTDKISDYLPFCSAPIKGHNDSGDPVSSVRSAVLATFLSGSD